MPCEKLHVHVFVAFIHRDEQPVCLPDPGGTTICKRNSHILQALCVCCHSARTPIDMQLSMPPARRPHQHYAAQGGAARACAAGLPFHVRTSPASAATCPLCVMFYCSHNSADK